MTFTRWQAFLGVVCILALSAPKIALGEQPAALRRALTEFGDLVPATAGEFTSGIGERIRESAERVESEAAESYDAAQARGLQDLLDAKREVDERVAATIELRRDFAGLSPDALRRDRIREYLQSMTHLIDLSARLRYLLFDACGTSLAAAAEPNEIEELLDLLIERQSSIGAVVAASLLGDAAENPRDGPRTTVAVRLKVLRLIAETGEIEVLPAVRGLITNEATAPELVVAGAETVRQIGLPQDPRPGGEPDAGKPYITAADLRSALAGIEPASLSAELNAQRQALLEWATQRQATGLADDEYRLGTFSVRPGDWLLMRNPSPYNLFTDLSPGLFTHVGVVTLETGLDGVRRMVVIDLPERGATIPATNVETYIRRTLHCVFVRHSDPAVAASMAEAAASIVGNECEFDLNFRTDRIAELRGRPLSGRRIKTYCAGLLLLCAEQTEAPREEFFPIEESAAGGLTSENLAKLGLSIGQRFVSPTGALFSDRLEIVGRREPTYDPGREIEEAVFNHFAARLSERPLVPTPDLYQSLRLRMAEAARGNPLLAAAIAKAANVSAEMDLVSAAKAAAVVETLDEIAYGSRDDFHDARDAIRADSLQRLLDEGEDPEYVSWLGELREQHAELRQSWEERRLTPRELRRALVDFYAVAGRAEIDDRFFSDDESR